MARYRAIIRGQRAEDQRWIEPGEVFETDAKPGKWMEPLDEDSSLADLTKAELLELAEAEGVHIPANTAKADIIAAINEKCG